MQRRLFPAALAFLAIGGSTLFGQSRDFRAERMVLDDNSGNSITVQTPAGPITGGTLTIPDPGGSGQFLISNPSGGSQSVSGDMLPGADNTYDLGSGASRWQDIFLSGNASVAGQVQFVETGGGTDYVGFQAPAAVTANQIWTLPAADGTSGQALVTDGSGALSWATAGGTVSTNATLSGDGSGGSPLGINLAQGNTWTGLQTFAASFTILQNGRLALTNNDNNARDIRFQEPSGSGSQYIGLRAPSVSRNSNYVFPDSIGTAGQVLTLNTVNGFGDSATLGWTTPGGGGGGGASLTRSDQTISANNSTLTSTNKFIRLTSSSIGNFTVAGITAGSDGDILVLYNATGNDITLNTNDGNAAAADQFVIPNFTGSTTSAGGSATYIFIYDGGANKWIMIGFIS